MSGALVVFLMTGFLLVNPLGQGIVSGQKDSAGEYELKAAMLYNLANFVQWPDSASPGPRGSLHLCILGKDAFGDSLTSAVSQRPAVARPVTIRHLQNDTEFGGCHILYIGSSERKTATQIFSTLSGSNVLTVGEMTQFAAHGGMIQFSLEDQRVRFDINLDAASRAGLKVSSRLLALAQVVKN